MKKKLIPKHQVGKKILNWLGNQFIKFGNAQIAGDSGVGASMAIASGYRFNRDTGMWEQSEENIKEAEGLRNNLALLSAFGQGLPSGQLLKGAGASTAVSQMPMYGQVMPRAHRIGKFLTDVGMSYVGGQVVDNVSEALTGNSFAENFGAMFPKNKQYYATLLGDFFNPGYLLGGWMAPYLERGLTYVNGQVPALYNKALDAYRYRQALNAYNKTTKELSTKPVGRFFTEADFIKAPQRKTPSIPRVVPNLAVPASFRWITPENYLDNFLNGLVPDESNENE